MSFQRTPAKTRKNLNVRDTGLQGRMLVLVQVAWVVLVALALGLFVASIPSYLASLHILSKMPASDVGVQLSRQDVQQLRDAGLSVDFYAWYNVVLNCLFVLCYSLVGVVIFLRKPENRVALFASITLVMFSIDHNNIMLRALPPIWNVPILGINFLGSLSISLFILFFPNGRLVPRWTRWLAVAQVIYWIIDVFLPLPATLVVQLLNFVVFLLLQGSLIVVQVYRYRYLSSPIERQQTKWVVFGTSLGLGSYLVGTLVVFALLRDILNANIVFFITGYTLLDGLLLFFPISLAFAMLRSHLWDIDVLINRTLVYGTLTASLALIYAGLVITSQYFLRGFIGQTNNVAIVGSTLAIAALFQPMRRYIQAIIDRRFYRRKYDAAKTLEAFSSTLRNEVDLSHLREQLIEVVQETMQPAHVSLWLRPTGQDRRYRVWAPEMAVSQQGNE
jgi:hypothetical protein